MRRRRLLLLLLALPAGITSSKGSRLEVGPVKPSSGVPVVCMAQTAYRTGNTTLERELRWWTGVGGS